ncbi:restriction endonuclease subunit S [Sedimentitalea todarodis]|uniref:Restriction endonuclease subunit S n=1 Tax=Sedimentitalea todarodis TaxID=1631240 RepID=A0ABU3VB94_9RHOB|nr:restriction endonuclease subunit S [Sedimentitalea todarodis]MDU9003436.1 restriction endonuclease subunit S [Sedimentitalea todarodis]
MSGRIKDSFPQTSSLPRAPIRLGLCARIYSGGTPDKNNEEFWTDGDLPWIGSGEVNQSLIMQPTAHITEQAVRGSATKLFPQGSLVMALAGQGKTKATVAQMGIDAFGNQSLACIDDYKGHNRYLFWWLRSLYREIRGLSSQDTRDGLNQSMLGQIPVPDIDLDTQKSIADFLDRETARIDQLIEKRDRFASLVREARDARIAVSLVGPSSMEPNSRWLARLPEGWLAQRAKVHFRERQERSATGDEELLTVSHLTGVTRRSEKDVNMFLAESNEGYKVVYQGDIVINTMWAWMGAMGVSPVHGIISPSYGIYHPVSAALLPEYVERLIRSKPFVAEATRRSKGIHSSRLRLYPDAFLDMLLPIPPIDAQEALLADLNSRIDTEDRLLLKNEEARALLLEFRSALITAAVTGQIDVTTWGKQGSTDRRLDQIEEEMSA